MADKENEETLEDTKSSTTAKTSRASTVSKSEFEKVKKGLALLKKETNSELKSVFTKLSKNEKDMSQILTSLSDIVKRLDLIEDSLDEEAIDKINALNVNLDQLYNRIENIEDDVGVLIDKVDVIFVGNDDESGDINSRIQRLEENLYCRLYKKNA